MGGVKIFCVFSKRDQSLGGRMAISPKTGEAVSTKTQCPNDLKKGREVDRCRSRSPTRKTAHTGRILWGKETKVAGGALMLYYSANEKSGASEQDVVKALIKSEGTAKTKGGQSSRKFVREKVTVSRRRKRVSKNKGTQLLFRGVMGAWRGGVLSIP